MGRPQNVIKPKPVAPSSWTAPIALWIATLHASNLSPRYIADARAFITRAAAAWAVDPDDVTLAHLLEWSTRGVKASTMATERSFIRSFFSLLWEEGMISRDPSRRLPRVKVRAGKPRPLTVEQVELMLSGIQGGRPAYRRTRAMILLGALQGWRVAEIARARGEMFDLEANVVHFVAKGPKDRQQPLHPTVRALAEHVMPRRGLWFPNAEGTEPVLPRSVSSLISNRMRTVGITDPRITAHSLRHFFGTQLTQAGVELRMVAELMGHDNPATTMRYTEVDHTQAGIALASIPSLSDEVYPTAAIIPVLEQLRENGPRASMHGSNAAYRKGCRCSECRSGHAAANARWRENRAARALSSTVPALVEGGRA